MRPDIARKAGIPALALLGVIAIVAPSAAAGGGTLDGQATIHFGGGAGGSGSAPHYGLSNAPCDPGSFCGVGNFRGIGKAMVYLDGDSYGDDVDGHNCVSYDKDEAIVPLDGSGVLVLHSSGTACFPSDANQAPARTDFGNPQVDVTTYTVDSLDSEGRFAGATGTGSEKFAVAGDQGQWTFSGSLTTGG